MLKKLMLLILCGWLYSNLSAQDSTKADVRQQNEEKYSEIKSAVDVLKKIKLSGYVQAQYQNAEAPGIASFSGGNFPASSKSRFAVRRGRLKVTYDNVLSRLVLQVDITQSGVGIKDAYVSFTEPWLKSFGLTAGVFDRPFGFEITYSSSSRESPERSRMFQTLFPGERDLGAKIEFAPNKGPLSFLNINAGLFNGTGGTAPENDNYKDFIGRAGFKLPFESQNLVINGGVSVYSGKVRSNTKYIYKFDEGNANMILDSSLSNLGSGINRSYTGADIQINYKLPIIGGLSLRGEYITGKQPGAAQSNSFYNLTDANAGLYHRKFAGYYIFYVQDIISSNQLLVKYDVFDPNIDVEGNEIGITGKNLSTGDIKFSTLGLGWIYHWDKNIKFVLYYDMVKNEEVNPAAIGSLASFKDDVKDDVLTLRMQYKF